MTIQLLAKIGRIFAKIIWIAGSVGAVLMVAGIISLACGLDSLVKIGDVTIRGLVTAETNLSVNQTYIVLTAGAIMAVGNAVMAWFADRYCTRQIKAGTPFTKECAQGMHQLGWIYVVGAIITACIATFAVWLMQTTMHTTVVARTEGDGAFIAGIMFLVLGLVFRYGAEKTEPATTDHNTVYTTATATDDKKDQ